MHNAHVLRIYAHRGTAREQTRTTKQTTARPRNVGPVSEHQNIAIEVLLRPLPHNGNDKTKDLSTRNYTDSAVELSFPSSLSISR